MAKSKKIAAEAARLSRAVCPALVQAVAGDRPGEAGLRNTLTDRVGKGGAGLRTTLTCEARANGVAS